MDKAFDLHLIILATFFSGGESERGDTEPGLGLQVLRQTQTGGSEPLQSLMQKFTVKTNQEYMLKDKR